MTLSTSPSFQNLRLGGSHHRKQSHFSLDQGLTTYTSLFIWIKPKKVLAIHHQPGSRQLFCHLQWNICRLFLHLLKRKIKRSVTQIATNNKDLEAIPTIIGLKCSILMVLHFKLVSNTCLIFSLKLLVRKD